MILTGSTVVTGDPGTPADPSGWVRISDGRITATGSGPSGGDSDPDGPSASGHDADDEVIELAGGWLVPGFIDIHCHGGDGADFASGDPEELHRAASFHQRHGTTSMLASLVTNPADALSSQLRSVAAAATAADGPIVGAHLEGPFLSRIRCGAQNPGYLMDPDLNALADWLKAADGFCRMITVAPELRGALELIDAAVAEGIVAAVGHTDATFAQAMAAFERGASVATHLFNGMRPVHHREPGPALAALQSGAACELINDGVHLHPAMLRLVADRDPGQLVLITDAISAAGAGDGEYRLGGQPVVVAGGQARLGDNGSLAGSVLTMDSAVRRAVQAAGLSLPMAVAAATSNPARVLGLAGDRGTIATGMRADLVHLDADLRPLRVMRAGRWQ